MQQFVIADGAIENIIEADEGFTLPGKAIVPVGGSLAEIGWAWVNGAPVPPVGWVEPQAPTPSTNPADWPLTMRQLRIGLFMNGYAVDFLQTVINGIADPTQKALAQIWYDETSVVMWDHPMTQALMSAAGITTEAATSMWLQAKDLAA